MGLDPSAAQNTRGVVDIPIPDFSGQRAAAEALDGVGKAMLEFGNKLQEAETDRKIVTATNATRSELDKTKRSILEDPNVKPEDYEKVYQERSDAIFKNYGATIPGGKAKAVWDKYTGDLGFSGLTEMRSATRQKQLENATAETIATVAKTVEGFADLDQSEEVFTSNFTATHEYISGQVKSGLMAPDRGAQALAELETGFRKAYTERTLYAIDGMRQAKNYAGATEALYAAKKDGKIDDKSFTATRAVLLNEQNGFEAQGDADKYWQQGKGYQGALALAREEKDVGLRQEVEKLLATRETQDKLAKQAGQEALSKQIRDHVLADPNNTVANVPLSILSQVTESATLALGNSLEAARNRENGMSEVDKAALAAMSKRISRVFDDFADTDTQRFSSGYDAWDPQTRALYDGMRNEEQLRVDDMVRETRINGRSGNAVTRLAGDLTDVMKRYAPADWKVGSTGDNETAQALTAREMIREIATANAESTGGKPMDARRLEELVLPIFRKLDDKKNWLEIPAVEMQSWASKQSAQMTVTGIDNVLWAMVKARLTGANGGVEPSKADIVAGYLRQGGKLPAGWN